MYKNKKIIVVTPAYKEERLIDKVIKGLPSFVDNIVIVDDASPDKTSEVVKKNSTEKVILIKHKKNKGVGGAIKTAIEKAKELNADITVTMAGDNQMDPKYLVNLLDPICDGQADYTKGNRFFSKSSLKDMPIHRVVGSVILTFLTRFASGYWSMFDPQNGYVAAGPKVLKDLDFNGLANGFVFENDLLINLNILGMRVKDVTIPSVYGEEISKMRLWKIIPSFTWFLMRGFFRRIFQKYILRGFHPIALFLLSGSILFWWGVIFGILKWKEASLTGTPTTTGTVMLAALPLLMGFEMILWGFVLDIQEEPK